MKKWLNEFKTFISRGSVMDLAVGTIIGGAFTAIVTALSNGILKPLINTIIYYCAGGNTEALSSMYSVLVGVYKIDEATGSQVLDLANSVYIDWGAFISAIINFILIAIVLFLIVKAFNTVKTANSTITDKKKILQIKIDKGIKLTKKEEKMKAEIEAAEAEEAAKKAEEEAKAAEEVKKPTQEELLAEILAELKKKNK